MSGKSIRVDESEQKVICGLLYAVYVVAMKEYTTIQIRKETREKLKKLKLTRRESYDEIINRLIGKCKESS